MTDNTPATVTPAELVDKYSGDFATVLPSHIKPETWIRVAQGALRRNEDLAKAAARNPGSFLNALLDAARLGLDPGSDQYYLVPFGSEVTGIVGYQGEVEMIYRAGAVSSVKAEVVYSNDKFDYAPHMDRPHHTVDWFGGSRGEMVGVYAYAVMRDGSTSRVVMMTKDDIARIKAVAKGTSRNDSPWNMWEDRMWLKSAVHQLAKWVPTSAEYRNELRADQAAVAAAHAEASRPPLRIDVLTEAGPVDSGTGEVVDAELVGEAAD